MTAPMAATSSRIETTSNGNVQVDENRPDYCRPQDMPEAGPPDLLRPDTSPELAVWEWAGTVAMIVAKTTMTARPATTARGCCGLSLSTIRSGVPKIQQHDDEDEQHHNRAGIDDDLNGGDKDRVQGQEQQGDAEQDQHQVQRTADRVVHKDHGDTAHDGDGGEDAEQGGVVQS